MKQRSRAGGARRTASPPPRGTTPRPTPPRTVRLHDLEKLHNDPRARPDHHLALACGTQRGGKAGPQPREAGGRTRATQRARAAAQRRRRSPTHRASLHYAATSGSRRARSCAPSWRCRRGRWRGRRSSGGVRGKRRRATRKRRPRTQTKGHGNAACKACAGRSGAAVHAPVNRTRRKLRACDR